MAKSMLITGASTGIGAATAILAAEQGWNVGVGYNRDADGAQKTCDAIVRTGQIARAIQVDVSHPPQIANMFETFHKTFGSMQAFINNAGIVMPKSRFEDVSPDRLDTLFRVNQTGAFIAAQHAVRAMAKRHGGAGGTIVNVSSIAAVKGGPNEYIDYAMTKGAMDAMTIGLAMEMAQQGVRVNAVRPGIIETDIHAKGGQPDRAERIAPSIPMGRAGTSQEVAEAILFLASEASSYTTGTFIEVSGARHV